MDITGMAAIVTGGASGLGAATAAMLARNGAKVAIFDLDETLGYREASRIKGTFLKVDVTSEEDVEAGLDAAAALNGKARILVNCAGIAPAIMAVRPDGPHPMDAYRRTLEVNLVGTFLMLSRFAQRLIETSFSDEETGVIVNTASIAAFDGHVGHAAYSASKAGVVGMALPLARELGQYHIRVMTIAPGLFLTPMLTVAGATPPFLMQLVDRTARMHKFNEV